MTEFTGRDFGRLESKVDMLIQQLRDHADDDRTRLDAIDTKLATLKSSHDYSSGRNAVIAFLVSAFTAAGGGWLARNL